MEVSGESERWEEMTSSLSQTWLGPRLLLVCLLVSRSITEKDLKNCSYMIGDGHLRLLQQLVSVWPYLPFSLLGKLRQKPGSRVREGWQVEKQGCAGHGSWPPPSSHDAPLIDLLKVRASDPFPSNSEALAGSPAGRRQNGLLAGCLGE